MNCSCCGQPLEEEWKYCPRCNVPIDFEKVQKEEKIGESEIEVNNTRKEEREETRKNQIVGIVVLSIIGLSLGGSLARSWLLSGAWQFGRSWQLSRAWPYIICVLGVIGMTGVMIMKIIKPSQSQGRRIVFWICIICIVVGGVIIITRISTPLLFLLFLMLLGGR